MKEWGTKTMEIKHFLVNKNFKVILALRKRRRRQPKRLKHNRFYEQNNKHDFCTISSPFLDNYDVK